MEHAFEKRVIWLPRELGVDLEHTPAGPRVHRRIDVAERPLVRRDLPVRMHVPFTQEQLQLALGEIRVHQRERDHVKRQVPRGIPGILPCVRHRDHVFVEQVNPLGIAPLETARRRRRLCGITLQPLLHHEMIELLRPEQPGERLPLHAFRVRGEARRRE